METWGPAAIPACAGGSASPVVPHWVLSPNKPHHHTPANLAVVRVSRELLAHLCSASAAAMEGQMQPLD